jgi:hypothetical protein
VPGCSTLSITSCPTTASLIICLLVVICMPAATYPSQSGNKTLPTLPTTQPPTRQLQYRPVVLPQYQRWIDSSADRSACCRGCCLSRFVPKCRHGVLEAILKLTRIFISVIDNYITKHHRNVHVFQNVGGNMTTNRKSSGVPISDLCDFSNRIIAPDCDAQSDPNGVFM